MTGKNLVNRLENRKYCMTGWWMKFHVWCNFCTRTLVLLRPTLWRRSTRTSTSWCCFTLAGEGGDAPHCQIMCTDATVNLWMGRVHLSLGYVFLIRFHVCARSLPFGQMVAKNPVYFLQMIWDMAQYANHLIRHSNKGNIPRLILLHLDKVVRTVQNLFSHLSSPLLFSPGLILGSEAQTGIVQYEAVELIFCLSFVLVLSQHRPLYKDLLPHLHKRMYTHMYKCIHTHSGTVSQKLTLLLWHILLIMVNIVSYVCYI